MASPRSRARVSEPPLRIPNLSAGLEGRDHFTEKLGSEMTSIGGAFLQRN